VAFSLTIQEPRDALPCLLFPIGTILDFRLQIDGTLLVEAKVVVTCDPQAGNRIQFIKMLPQAIEELKAFIGAAEKAEPENSK
jgi:hypothetical protein